MSDRFAGRSIHGAPPHALRLAEHPVLHVTGAVARPLELGLDELSNVKHVRFLDRFPPDRRENWPETDWSGASIATLIALAEPDPNAQWIQVLGGPFATVIPIEDIGHALICDRIGDHAIPVENGGPFRLIYPNENYNLCVKWADSVVVSHEEPDRSAERIAIARQRARDARS